MPVDMAAVCRGFINKTGSDLIAFASPVNDAATNMIRQVCAVKNDRERAVLLLTTPGGDADAAFRIARTLRRRYKHVTIVIHGECKSAGTLIALCADDLVMSDTGELGPLDVQLERQTEIGGPPQSGLDLTQALRVLEENAIQSFRAHVLEIRMGSKLSTKLACKLAAELTNGVYRYIYEQIDPVRLGEIHRKIVIANEYGGRLASGNVKDGAVAALVAQYPSHGFVIDREEAQDLFHKVRPPNEDELSVLEALPPFFFELQYEKTYVVRLEPPDEQKPVANSPSTAVTAGTGVGAGSGDGAVAAAAKPVVVAGTPPAGAAERDVGSQGHSSVEA